MNTLATTKPHSVSPRQPASVSQTVARVTGFWRQRANASQTIAEVAGFRRQLAGVALVVAAVLAFWSRLPGLAEPLRDGPAPARVVTAPLAAGQRFDLAIRADGVTSLAAFEATLRFDPAALAPVSTRLGDFAPDGSALLEDRTGSAGRLAVGSYNGEGHSTSGGGVLALVTFEALAAGGVEIRFDPEATAAFDALGQPLSARLSLVAPGGAIYLPQVSR